MDKLIGAAPLNRRQQSYPHGDDRERITRARQAAEALFTPKRSVGQSPVSESLTPADQSVRKPRVLPISPPEPVRREEVKATVRPEPRTIHEIPRSQFARVRTWVKYGMTVSQVAEVYGASVGEIERILRKA